jgi:hypothetical protein
MKHDHTGIFERPNRLQWLVYPQSQRKDEEGRFLMAEPVLMIAFRRDMTDQEALEAWHNVQEALAGFEQELEERANGRTSKAV